MASRIPIHCNRCGSDMHITNACPRSPFIKQEEVHIAQGNFSSSPETSEFEYDTDDLSELEQEVLFISQNCQCSNPNQCSCSSTEESETDESIEETEEELDRKMPKLKVCMASRNIGEDAQMLAQIQALPEGEMKASLLDSFLKTMMKTTQKSHDEMSSGKKPVFVDASFEKNTKSFIKHNRNERL